tara:strand:- start:217 stop:783 length:567 start_codon:yes stop_codon:yes gene_type:complete
MLDGFRVLGLDLETTGFNPRSDRIVQYALVGSEADGTHVNLQSVVNPGVKISSESSNVHGITDEDVVNESGFENHLRMIAELVEGSIIVGHNVIDFDWRFIEVECARCGAEVPVPHATLDTLVLARRLGIPRPHKLGSLCERFGISLERAHSADADAGATLLLLWKIMRGYPERFKVTVEELVQSLSQ